MLHLGDMRKSMRNRRVAASEVSQELDKTMLVRKAALDFHLGLFPTQAAALKANNLDSSQRQGVFYHVKQLRGQSLPTPFKPVDIAVKVINHMILLGSLMHTYTAAIKSKGCR